MFTVQFSVFSNYFRRSPQLTTLLVSGILSSKFRHLLSGKSVLAFIDSLVKLFPFLLGFLESKLTGL